MSFAYKIKDAFSGRQYNFQGFEESENSGLYTEAGGVSVPMVMPLRMKAESQKDNEWWLLPWEPLISVNGRNMITTRNVAKAKKMAGSIKERWTQDDWEITIEGIFTNPETNRYPRENVERLRRLCEANEVIEVQCPLLDALQIDKIVIEEYDLPFTVGPENQDWSIKALSDRSWELLIAEDKK